MNVMNRTRDNAPNEDAAMKISKLSPHVGAEVTGIDLRQPIDEATRRRLYDALVEHIALVIRDQDFTPADFLAAAKLFGVPELATRQKQVSPEAAPGVFQLSSRDIDKNGVRKRTGGFWHTDSTQQPCPPKFTTLYPVELPKAGTFTSLANMRVGYEALPEAVKQRIATMQTVNILVGKVPAGNPDLYGGTKDLAINQQGMTPAIHPLVRTHPEDGHKVLYFNPIKIENIVGMNPEDSHDYLDRLLELALKPEFIYHHGWKQGDMLIWDNRSAMHRAGHREGDDYDENDHRTFNRVTLKGP